jgi:hypothetical protein
MNAFIFHGQTPTISPHFLPLPLALYDTLCILFIWFVVCFSAQERKQGED